MSWRDIREACCPKPKRVDAKRKTSPTNRDPLLGNMTLEFPFRSDFRLDEDFAFLLSSSGHPSMWLMYENMMTSICSKRSLRRLCCNAIMIPLDENAEKLCDATKSGNCHYIDREYVKKTLYFESVKKTSNPEMDTQRVWGDENYSFQFWMNPFIHIKAWYETLPAIVSDADISILNDPISAMDDVKGISYACDDPEFDFRANAGFVYQTANDEAFDILRKWVRKMEDYGAIELESRCPPWSSFAFRPRV